MTDLALQLLRHGYDAVAVDRQARDGGDDYRTRLAGRRALVVRSPEGARTFYDEGVVERKGAVPLPLAWLLFGRGAVHALDDTEHRDRKLLFLEILSPGGLEPVVDGAERHLREAAAHWRDRSEVRVFDELVLAYGRAVLGWAGLELDDTEAARWSRTLAEIVDGFGFSGRAYGRAWAARRRANRWAADAVREVRSGRRAVDRHSALGQLAAAGDLDDRTAGVELLNVLRPTVAVAWPGSFAAARLPDHPQWRDRMRDPDAVAERFAFAQEVRRTTPFAPVLAGRVRTARAEVEGGVVRRRQLVVLDVIGINHDPARWSDPEEFRPERFLGRQPGAFDLVAQGGGHPSGHRCPGESLALRLLQMTLCVLADLPYEVHAGEVDRRRIPTLPEGGPQVRMPVPTRSQ